MEYKLATNSWDSDEVSAIENVIKSNNFSMGEKVAQYERTFASYIGSRFSLMVNSGSSANLLMIAALFFTKDKSRRLKRGDEVIVPAVSWSTTYFPLQQYGLKVVFIDIDRKTLNMDLDQLKAAINVKTKLIFAVNLLGNCNDFESINRIIDGKNITLLEDNCESLGSTFNGQKAGTFGLMGSYSSYFSHHITTMEGGCITTDNEELYHILLAIRAHGWTRNLPQNNLVTGIKSDNLFDESFKFVLPGYNVRPLEINGAIGIEQIRKLPDFIEVRRRNAEHFQQTFLDHPFMEIQSEIGKSSWFGFALIVREGSDITRKEVVQLLTKNNIECRPIVTGNFLKNSEVLQYFDYRVFGSTINAEYIDENGLFVGNQQVDIRKEIDYLADVLSSY